MGRPGTRGEFRAFRGLSRDLAIDLGTASTLIHQRGRGIVLDEPSVVAVSARTGDLVAAGGTAKETLGRTPGAVRAVQPLRGGVISDPDAAEQMLRWFTDRVGMSSVVRPRVVVCIPSDITGVERRAVEETALRVGARRVYLVEEPMVAAIGAGLPVTDNRASMVVDIGGGSTDVAVMALGGIVASRSTRTAGDAVDEAIAAHVRRNLSLLLGERTAEEIKVAIGSAFPLASEVTTRVRGRDLVTGLPKTVDIGSAETRRAIAAPLEEIIGLVREVLDRCPPELAGDVLDRGITLTGGGALLRGIDERMRHDLGVPVTVAESPVRAVARGAGRCVDDFAALEPVLVDGHRF